MRAIACVVFLLLSSPVLAQDSQVRTGDHDGYTRVVIDLPAGSDWRVGRSEDGFAIHLPAIDSLDASQFFDRIKRDRIVDIRFDDSILHLASNCDCSANAFEFSGEMLVVDIRDGTQDANPKFNSRIELAQRDRPFVPIAENHPVQSSAAKPAEPAQAAELAEVFERPTPTFYDVRDLTDAVVQGVARATTQGLLTPAESLSKPVEEPGGEEAQFLLVEGALAGLETRSSIDLSLADTAENINADGLSCLPDTFFNIADWGDERSFAEQISEHRRGITGEFDRIDADAVVRLSQLYLFFGFGLEAEVALEIDALDTRQRQILRAVAQIMDGEMSPSTVLENQYSCIGAVSLWSFLDHPVGNYGQTPEHEAILRSFKALPIHLQTHLAPRLADRFTATGHSAFADQALQTTLGAETILPETALALSEVALAEQGPEIAEEVLLNHSIDQSRMTPEMLLQYFALNSETGDLPDPEALALADIFRFEFRGTEMASVIAGAQIEALLRANDAIRASHVLDEETEALPGDKIVDLRSGIVEQVTESYSDDVFLEYAFDAANDDVYTTTQNIVAERLLALGFPERALAVISGQARGTDMAARRYLRARALIATNRPQAALDMLSGISTERANLLRDHAQLLIHDPIAGHGFEQSDEEVRAWRAGNWTALSAGPSDLLSDVSQAILDQGIAREDINQTLADGRALVEKSVQTRQMLDRLLDRFQPVESSQ